MYQRNLSEIIMAILVVLVICMLAGLVLFVRLSQTQDCREFCAPHRGRMIYPEGQSSYCMCEVPGVIRPS